MSIKSIWNKNIEKCGMPTASTGSFLLEYDNLRNAVKGKKFFDLEDYIKKMVDGKILILKNTLSKSITKKIKRNTRNFWAENSSAFHKMYDNCPNFHRIIDASNTSNYSVDRIVHTSFFFPWNKDDLGVRDIIMDRWRVIKEFTGLQPTEYENNTPSKGTCDRIQVVFYPPKYGLLDTHSDPTHNQLTFVSGYLSTRGKNSQYTAGGLYAIDNSGSKIDLEDNIVEGDFAVGLASIKHGVSQIDPEYRGELDWNGRRGRWLLGLYSNDSDHVKNRKTAIRSENSKC
jgi:hypothetical protein